MGQDAPWFVTRASSFPRPIFQPLTTPPPSPPHETSSGLLLLKHHSARSSFSPSTSPTLSASAGEGEGSEAKKMSSAER